jgi:CspA family cold shock protein
MELVREDVSMPKQLQVVVCQRCGRGFVLTPTYVDLRARRGAEVVVPVLCPSCFLREGPLPKQRGRVKWFDPRRRYGFIITEEGEEVFFHQQQILRGNGKEASEGQTAWFHVRYSAKGPEALNVELGKE